MPFKFSIGCCCGSCAVQVVAAPVAGDTGNHTQKLTTQGVVAGGSFVLSFAGQSTGSLAWDATAAQVQNALGSLPAIGTGNVACTGGPLEAAPIVVTLKGTLSASGQPMIAVTSNVQCCILKIAAADVAPDTGNHTQLLYTSVPLSGGSYTLSFNGQTTATLQWNSTAAQIQAALAALSTIGTGNVTCANGSVSQPGIVITLKGALANEAQPLIVVTPNITCCKPMVLTALGCPGYAGGTSQWPLPNAPIVINDLNGKKVASGTTDSNGQFSFTNGNANQTYTCIITAERFNQFSKQFTFTCGATATMNVCADAGPADGYACCQNYPYPLKTTLYYTDKNGTREMQFVAASGGSGGNCTLGTWQLCYNAPATVADPPDGNIGLTGCNNPRAGETLVGVGYCPVPGLSYPTVGCGPWQWIGPGEWSGCANAVAGASFFPESAGAPECYTSTQSETLDCTTLNAWISCSFGTGRGRVDQEDTYAPLGHWTVSLTPPAGFAGSGVWVDYGCNPIAGPYTISE